MGHGDDEPRSIAIEARFCVHVGIPGQAWNDEDRRLEMTICGSELKNVRLIQRTPIIDFVTLPNPSNQSTLIVYVGHRLPCSSCENRSSHKMELRPSRRQLL